jgi:adenine-specific DNA methylase
MVFDFPEAVFDNTDGPIGSQLSWIIKVIESESKSPFQTDIQNASSGEKNQFPEKSITAVVTDPPYYDAIGYADLSDFFYVWFKQTLSNAFPVNFSTPLTPKSEECTALKHHHNGNAEFAKNHFENKLLQIFDAIEYQTTDIVSIMFAHQSTEAWTTLCNSILGSKMNISGSWAIDTEITGALKVDKSFLTSSVTVSCVPSSATGSGDYKSIKSNIEETVAIEVEELYKLGFRGADLLTACFGKAVSEFGKYQIVEKADGSKVTVAELLDLARESAFNALLKGFEGDDYTKFYIAWLQLNSFTETDFDDAAKFTKIGLSINIHDLFKQHLLIKNGNKQYLGSMKDRINENKKLGEGINNPIIDYTHKLMFLYGSPNRNLLLKYLINNSIESENPIWRVITSLAELLPKDMEDYKFAIGLLTNKDQLIREAKSSTIPKPEQSQLTFE